MRQIAFTDRDEWRRWLAENHDKEGQGIWLVFYKKAAGRPSVGYEEAVEEALCFGWIDSIIKRIDDGTYCRKFTPRKEDSRWSISNKERVEKIIKEGRMTRFGMAKVDAARKSGNWEMDQRPVITMETSRELLDGLRRNRKAKDNFEKLAPSHQQRFMGWIANAKRPETRTKRLKESLDLLARGDKLGLR